MKSVFTIIFVFFMIFATAIALEIQPQVIYLLQTDNTTISTCLTNNTQPLVNSVLSLTSQCRDINNDNVCSLSENLNALSTFRVELLQNITNNNGCVHVKLGTTNATQATYIYELNHEAIGAVKVSDNTLAFIPEFGTIAMVLILATIGLIIAKKKN